MEDGLSYYGTIGALALISIAFYWLHKNDYETIQLAEEDIKAEKLVVVIVNSNHPFRYKLKALLERKGFIVYDIFLSKEKHNSVDRTSITINLECSNQTGEAAKFIKSKLDENQQKLHACLSLPMMLDDGTVNLEAPIQVIQELLMPRFSLLNSLLNTIGEHGARVVHIHYAGSFLYNDLSKLTHSLESSINRFLCQQLPKQMSKNFIEVNVRQNYADSMIGAHLEWASGVMCSVIRAIKGQLELEGSFSGCLMPGSEIISSGKRQTNQADKDKSCVIDPSKRERVDKKIIEVIERLVSQAFVYNQNVVIQS